MDLESVLAIAKTTFNRRKFLQAAGIGGVGVATATLLTRSATSLMAQGMPKATSSIQDPVTKDTPVQIFTAALIAEDLATTFYYNGLAGGVIQDPSLAGPGGTATHVTAKGNSGNVAYLRAALFEEITHANLFRELLGISGPGSDPEQTFYFPAGVFDTLAPFIKTLEALESAFIGAYMNAVVEIGRMAATVGTGKEGDQLAYYAEVATAILGVESEHRVLGRVISSMNPANNRTYEWVDGIYSVYNGSRSAVAALTPFLTSSTGPAYSFAEAVVKSPSVELKVDVRLPPA